MSGIGLTIPTWPFLAIAVAHGAIGFGRWGARADGSSRAIALCLWVLCGAMAACSAVAAGALTWG